MWATSRAWHSTRSEPFLIIKELWSFTSNSYWSSLSYHERKNYSTHIHTIYIYIWAAIRLGPVAPPVGKCPWLLSKLSEGSMFLCTLWALRQTGKQSFPKHNLITLFFVCSLQFTSFIVNGQWLCGHLNSFVPFESSHGVKLLNKCLFTWVRWMIPAMTCPLCICYVYYSLLIHITQQYTMFVILRPSTI